MEHPGLELVLILDAVVAGGSIPCCATVLTPVSAVLLDEKMKEIANSPGGNFDSPW